VRQSGFLRHFSVWIRYTGQNCKVDFFMGCVYADELYSKVPSYWVFLDGFLSGVYVRNEYCI